LITAPPFTMPPTIPRIVAEMRGSSTRVTRCVGGFVEPSSRVDRRIASAAASSTSRSVSSRPTDRPASIWVSPSCTASACTTRWHIPARPHERMPVLVATAPSPRESLKMAVRTLVTRGSRPVVARSSSRAIATLSAVGTSARPAGHRSSSAGATPSGSARPLCSSGSPNTALSRASASASSTTASSSVPA
jgi:hypothetical protein